jgi:Flp pilus assembly protein TadD
MLSKFLDLLASGKDNALLRFSLGNEYLKLGQASEAVSHLKRAVELNPQHSAAWKLLGRALAECDKREEARAAYEQGITVAEAKGDKQAAKEMRVFARRLRVQMNK